jgi:antirestriction protein ArdC
MAENTNSYNVSANGDKLQPADRIKIEHSVYMRDGQADISELTALPLERLQAMRENSAAEETKIFESLREATKAWDAQAGQTLLLDKAIEYARTPAVNHTANKWIKDDENRDFHSISNAVYKMNYHISESTMYDKAAQKSVPYAWDLTWSVRTNPSNHTRGTRIAGQDRKRFGDKAEMEKYLNGRMKAYANLFTEIAPPVPQAYERDFRVNGQLLPGYTLQSDEARQTPQPETKQPDPLKEVMDSIATRKAAVATATAPTNAAPTAPEETAAHKISVTPIVLTSENPREKLKEITAKLEQGIKGVFDSDNYKAYLQTLSKFHNYSLNNTLLIAFQNPEATQIAGFSAWKNNFKRQVMKGEKGIKIIAPSPFTMKKEMEKIDPQTGRPVIGKNGKPLTEEMEITVPAFKVVSVFDVSQTEGEPIPTLEISELTGSVDRYKEFFAALEKVSPVPVAFENIETNAKGYYHFGEDGKRIAIREGMSELQTLKTAVHEICHARLHDADLNTKKGEETRTDRHSREVEAESVAYVVCQRYGLDTSDYSFAYAAKWSGDKELDILKASLETIRNTANDIITDIDKHFTVTEKDKAQEQASDSFTIYQLKRIEELRDYRFEPLDRLQAAGLAILPGNYEQTYTAPLAAAGSPEKIFERFNLDRPEDFKGHSLSVSDIIVFNRSGEQTAVYVDGAGFKDVSKEFLHPAPVKAQIAPSVAELEAKAKRGEQINLTDLATAMKAEKPERKPTPPKQPQRQPSIRDTLKQSKEQLAQARAAAPQRTAAKRKANSLEV